MTPAIVLLVPRRASRVSGCSNGRNSRMERKKTGRPSKGERTPINIRVPTKLQQAVKNRAKQRGMTLNDYVGSLLAQDTGVPYDAQEGLPLSQAS